MVGCLTGLRVLNFSIVVQGPQCTVMLADLGADVIKIERRTFGDIIRGILISASDRRNAYFYALNRRKCSMTLDITHPEGVAIVQKLLATADVMVSSSPGDWAPELGQHTEEVLLAAGYTWEQIERFRAQEII